MYDLKFLTTAPFSRINDFIPSTNLDIENIKVTDFIIDNNANSYETRYQFELLQSAFVYVATETVFNYPCPFLSEKSFKGITAKRPFILVASPFSLRKLKDLGFKTFDNYWDESYDVETDPVTRLLLINNLIKNICDRSPGELKKQLTSMKSILEYNFNYYKNYFYQDQLSKFKKALNCLE